MQSVIEPGKALVISPHLDDAVFGCGHLLAGCAAPLVVTVFAGVPAAPAALTRWDRRCHFVDSKQAMQVRLREDAQALAELGARGRYLGFLDSQYGELPTPRGLAGELINVLALERPDTVWAPLGLHHCDHECVFLAALHTREAFPGLVWLGYEDMLYRRRAGVLQARLVDLFQKGVAATPVSVPFAADPAAKARAVAAYGSQLAAAGAAWGGGDLVLPERYWLFTEN